MLPMMFTCTRVVVVVDKTHTMRVWRSVAHPRKVRFCCRWLELFFSGPGHSNKKRGTKTLPEREKSDNEHVSHSRCNLHKSHSAQKVKGMTIICQVTGIIEEKDHLADEKKIIIVNYWNLVRTDFEWSEIERKYPYLLL